MYMYMYLLVPEHAGLNSKLWAPTDHLEELDAEQPRQFRRSKY